MAQNLNFNLAVDTNTAVSSINQFFQAFDAGAAKAKGELNKAFGQNLQTTVEINLKNGELVAKKVQNINQESKRLGEAVDAINGKWGKTPNQLKRQISKLKEIQGNTEKVSSKTGKVSSDWKLVSQRIKEAQNELKRMTVGGTFKQLQAQVSGVIGKFTLVQTLANVATGAVMGLARSFGEFANTAGRMEVLALQMEAFTGSSEAADKAFSDFVDIAAKTPFNLEQVATAGKTMMAFGMDTDQAVLSTQQLGIVAAATGGDVNLLARNLGQISAQGQAYTRDLTQFAIQGIPIWQEMSKVTGRTVSELKSMASEGQISFEIVQNALTNLTGEGSAFLEIAERMQETFQGRLAAIEASFQKLAKEMVDTFNAADKAFGGVVSGSMKAFAEGVKVVANNLDGIATALVAATVAAGAFFLVNNWSSIVGGIKLVAAAIKGVATMQNLANAAAIVFNGLVGNWAGIAAAIGAGAVAYAGFNAAINSAKSEQDELNQSMDGAITKVGEITAAQEKLAQEAGFKNMINDYKELNKELENKAGLLEQEIEKLKAMKDVIKSRYQGEIDAIKAVMDEQKVKEEEEKSAHRDRMTEIGERYDAAVAAIDMEIGKLRDRTKEEQALYDFNKKQLQTKISSGKLSKEELLNAQARLSRMKQQEAIAKKLEEKESLRLQKAKEETEELGRHEDAVDAIIAKYDENKQQLDDVKNKRNEEIRAIDDTIRGVKNMQDAIDLTNVEVGRQIELVNSLAGQYSATKDQVDRLAVSLRNAAAAQRELSAANARRSSSSGSSSGGGGLTARFAGGPVTGGTSYQVNELGREAFLSASGKLSMIDAPAFGEWKAPGAGTVIPAHLTQQLNIPTGGINVNHAAKANASRAGGGGMSGVVKAIKASMAGGDTFHQNVTVQSSNPTQTANNMMVQMTRLKRRYR